MSIIPIANTIAGGAQLDVPQPIGQPVQTRIDQPAIQTGKSYPTFSIQGLYDAPIDGSANQSVGIVEQVNTAVGSITSIWDRFVNSSNAGKIQTVAEVLLNQAGLRMEPGVTTDENNQTKTVRLVGSSTPLERNQNVAVKPRASELVQTGPAYLIGLLVLLYLIFLSE